ncbi:MAG: esterase [Muribaculaceae bacterium]|nr:esterase [Muribaculaceae bacterium]
MKKTFLLSLFAMCLSTAMAQQALWNNSQIVSPLINEDNSVTFTLFAPNAQTVQVTGDFLPAQEIEVPDWGKVKVPGVADLSKDENGVWSFTTAAPLSPELYMYSFLVDGVKTMDPSNVYMIRDVASVTNIFLIDGEGSRAHAYRVNDVPHGTVSRVWYDSPGLNKKRRMSIYTPPGYEDSQESYPVFYLLHGAGGDEEAWLALGRTAQIMDNLIAEGKAQPMIVVMTNGNPTQEAAPGETSEGLIVPGMDVSRMNQGEFETSFPDVINYVDQHYRTKTDKANRAIGGLSMGGFHSLHTSKLYPDLFDYVGLFSAAIFPFEGRDQAPVYQDFEGKLKTQFEKNPKLYWIGIGDEDFLYKDNEKFRKILDENGYPYEYYETPDGHIWKNWRIYLTEFAPKLFK